MLSPKTMQEFVISTIRQENTVRLYLQFRSQDTKRNSRGFPQWVKLKQTFYN